MKRLGALLLALSLLAGASPALAKWHVVSDEQLVISDHPESVASDPKSQTLYVSNFGEVFKPTLANGEGYISKLDMAGKVLDKRFLPGPGQTLNKPKGVWISDGLLWTTDIDAVWCFDLESKKGVRLPLPGSLFANDVCAANGKLYVSDTTAGRIYLVEPADFRKGKPSIRVMLSPPGFHPNGLWPRPGGGVIIATQKDMKGPGGLFQARDVGQMSEIRGGLGRLDGVAMLPDGAILYTDWAHGGLFILEGEAAPRKLATGFGGPADFGLVPVGKGFLVAIPDLVTGNLRMVSLEP
ncbi:MAG: hypothetical protein K9K66_08565 [Desulfarculaceae bacterium]|nr:hypothetical protein [Desulfarculaceae bacterium]MCF8071373.1 hypothetical protein [Desulfarculaceae bacterium]MCF8101698.1 hypothetical protein [Desulfarculaceae bacterium]MCF8116693.1 hypothetical protein [Desulfarculaceae bacterium]